MIVLVGITFSHFCKMLGILRIFYVQNSQRNLHVSVISIAVLEIVTNHVQKVS